jgi:hypothetical protein
MVSGEAPDYFRDVYGDATIGWVPPVYNYKYVENVPERGADNSSFRWEEVQIDLDDIQSGAWITFTMPDMYMLQVTPDLGWNDELAMFGETNELPDHNPHLVSLGPFSIENGTLTDNEDNSVTVALDSANMQSAVIDGYDKYLWRAVPWADGNPGLGGVGQPFTYISSIDQLKFTVDEVIKETNKSIQTISGTKSTRVTITIEDDGSNPEVFVEQTETTWKVLFNIDRPRIIFRIVATDSGGTAVGYHKVDIEYDSFGQDDIHIWNVFDSFALMASLDRLPEETNSELKERIMDAFENRGAPHYSALIKGMNRELGLQRYDSAISITRTLTHNNRPAEDIVSVESNHVRMSVFSPNMIIYDEIQRVNSYYNTLRTTKRINNIISITTSSDIEIAPATYSVTEDTEGNEILFTDIKDRIVKITYLYKEDIDYETYPKIGDVVAALNAVVNQSNLSIVDATIDTRLSGEELAKYIYKSINTINIDNPTTEIGWSLIGLFAISNEEYKQSFADEANMYFDSDFFKFVMELKSKTNIEWGFVIADKDFWDSVDSEQYGRDSLPIVFDPKISHYVTAIPVKDDSISFDPWESMRNNYYYDSLLIKNVGYPQTVFRSGVGFKKDCAVSTEIVHVNAAEKRVNQNPVVYAPEDKFEVTPSDVANYIVNL